MIQTPSCTECAYYDTSCRHIPTCARDERLVIKGNVPHGYARYTCEHARTHNHLCGAEGNWFVAKDPSRA